jgi:hypothetical protein
MAIEFPKFILLRTIFGLRIVLSTAVLLNCAEWHTARRELFITRSQRET